MDWEGNPFQRRIEGFEAWGAGRLCNRAWSEHIVLRLQRGRYEEINDCNASGNLKNIGASEEQTCNSDSRRSSKTNRCTGLSETVVHVALALSC